MKALRIATRVASIINVEYKNLDTPITAVLSAATASPLNGFSQFFPLTQMAQGDSPNQRNGNSILLKSLMLRHNFTLNAGPPALDHVNIRMMLVRWDSASGITSPDIHNILDDPIDALGWVRVFRNIDNVNVRNFKVLWDKRITLDTDYKSEVTIDKYFKLRHHAKFVGSALNQMAFGHLFMVYMYDNLAASGSFTLNADARLRYIDN